MAVSPPFDYAWDMDTLEKTQTEKATVLHLQELEIELTQRLQSLSADLSQSHSADSSEQAIERENDEVLEQLRNDTAVELHQVKHALERIKTGDYFTCEGCGGEISPARLDVLPYTELCINCADKAS